MKTPMRKVLLGSIAATIISAIPAFAATAYDAMRTVGKEKSEAVLEKITEVRGLHGSPQPTTWRISTRETSYDVRSAKLASTSAGRPLTPLNLSELKLDSDGAHTVAEREAKKAAFSYDFADYTLRSGASSPVWEVRLVDEQSKRSATLNIGADTGKVISSEGLKKSSTTQTKTPVVAHEPPVAKPPKPPREQAPQYVQDDPSNYDPADDPTPPPPRRRPVVAERRDRDEDESDESGDSRYNQGYEKVIDRVGNHLKLRSSQLRSWFDRSVRPGGRPTYGSSSDRTTRYEREEREEPRQPERRTTTRPDPNETRYYRPAPGDRLRD